MKHTGSFSMNTIQDNGSRLFRLVVFVFQALLIFSLVSCNNGGSSTSTSQTNTTVNISNISPLGLVASSVPQTITLYGTNFSSGMTLSISGAGNFTTINIANPTITPTSITGSAVISTVPSNNYVTLTVKSGSTSNASTAMGVASADKRVATGIQSILSAKCAICHVSGGGVGGLDLSDATLGGGTGVIGISSIPCSQKLRVVPGDPRRTSSVVLDRIMPGTASQQCNLSKPMPPSTSVGLTTQEITDLIDWVAGGAK